MKGFLLDENLPARLTFSPGLPVVPVSNVGSSPTDAQVWEFARQRELVIVSKDADFSERIGCRTLLRGWCTSGSGIFAAGSFTPCSLVYGRKWKHFSRQPSW
jgi:hypothetical protein